MSSEISKATLEVTTKVAESVLPAVIQKVLQWRPTKEPRGIKHRAAWDRRHGREERRVSNPERRLRKGFWFEYYRKTEAGKFDLLDLTSRHTLDRLSEALLQDALRYEFSDRTTGTVLPHAGVIDSALDRVVAEMSTRAQGDHHAVVIVEMVAQQVLLACNIRRVDRREVQRRLAITG